MTATRSQPTSLGTTRPRFTSPPTLPNPHLKYAQCNPDVEAAALENAQWIRDHYLDTIPQIFRNMTEDQYLAWCNDYNSDEEEWDDDATIARHAPTPPHSRDTSPIVPFSPPPSTPRATMKTLKPSSLSSRSAFTSMKPSSKPSKITKPCSRRPQHTTTRRHTNSTTTFYELRKVPRGWKKVEILHSRKRKRSEHTCL